MKLFFIEKASFIEKLWLPLIFGLQCLAGNRRSALGA
jgi:hypothetical protein